MKEHYVSYECAQALKRLGFAEKVNHAYLKKISIEPEVSVGDLKEVHSKDPKNYNDNRKGAEKGLFFCSAPRLDQAAAWMRGCKGIDVEVTCIIHNLSKKDYKVCLCYFSNDLAEYKLVAHGIHSYENALSIGIDKALELSGKEVKE